MKTEHLRYILEIANRGSFNDAATALYISQPSLSNAVKKIEEEFGEPIFNRYNTGVTLTPFGESILPYIRDSLSILDQMPRQVYGKNSKGKPRLSVCNGGYHFVIAAVAALYEKHKTEGICLDIHDVSREKSLDMVAKGVAQIGGYGMFSFQKQRLLRQLKAKDVHFFPLTIAGPSVLVGPNNPLYTREEDWVTLDMVRQFPVVHSFNEHSVALFKRLDLSSTFNVITCSGRAGRKQLLDYIDCISIGAGPTTAYRRTELNPHRRIFHLKGVDYTAEIGYITHASLPLPQLADELIDNIRELLFEC